MKSALTCDVVGVGLWEPCRWTKHKSSGLSVLKNILQTIICDEFQKNVGRSQRQRQLDGASMYGMLLTFKLHEKDYGRESLYPSVQLLLYAPYNAVGVYYRESEHRDDYEPWQHLSSHDSCWRSDGVDRFISRYADRMAVLGWTLTNEWYCKLEISDQKATELSEITRSFRNRPYKKV